MIGTPWAAAISGMSVTPGGGATSADGLLPEQGSPGCAVPVDGSPCAWSGAVGGG